MRTENSNNIIIYLKKKNENSEILNLINWGIEIMKQFNSPPNYIGISGKVYNDKIVKIKTGIDKLSRNNYQGVDSFELYFSNSNSPSYDWELCLIISIGEHIEFFLGGNDDLISFDSIIKKLDYLLTQFSYESIYGYLFSRPFNLGPEFYPFGIGYGEISDEELDKATVWRKDLYGNKTFFEGKIRELYPINILNEKHLNFKLNNNKQFKNFISENKLILEKVTEDTYLLIVNNTKLINGMLLNSGVKLT